MSHLPSRAKPGSCQHTDDRTRSPCLKPPHLLVSCPDQKGLVSGISSFIFRHGGNILQSDQYTDVEAGIFLARFEFHLDGFQIPAIRSPSNFARWPRNSQ